MIRVVENLLSKGQKYHLAVSMGVDSVAALFWMRWKGYEFTPLHFDHNLRAQNGTMREKFHQLCESLGLQGVSDVGRGLKTEAECREARLDFYSRKAKDGTIVTAHHLDDWIEGYLLNCLRGHPSHDPIPLTSRFPDFSIAHPFLPTRKKDFRQFLERNGWMDWVVEDQTNSVVKGSRRNWVRTFIVPQMREQKLSLEKYARRRIERMTEDIKARQHSS
jgi:tRNA(Ile)-lysidine synthase TilS/MesJ